MDTQLQLPFISLNLRHNPFGEVSLNDRGNLAEVDTVRFLAHLNSAKSALQFIGDRGRGKTTHLLGIKAHVPNSHYVHIAEGEMLPRLSLPPDTVLFIDEIQRVPTATRARLFRQDLAFVIGTHEDVAQELRAANKSVMTVSVDTLVTPKRVQCAMNKRIEWARRAADRLVPRISQLAAKRLVQRFGSDVRAMEGQLYELFQDLDSETLEDNEWLPWLDHEFSKWPKA